MTFDSVVEVNTAAGTPSFTVSFEDSDNSARDISLLYVRGTGNRTLEFEYVVQSADQDGDGIYVAQNQLVLNGSTIQHISTGKDANLDHGRPGNNGDFHGHKVDGGAAGQVIKLCGARPGTPGSRMKEASIDLCWDLGSAVPTGNNVVLEHRIIGYWRVLEGAVGNWKRIGDGDSYAPCSGGSNTCVQFTDSRLQRGSAQVYQLRFRQGNSVVAISPTLGASAPNHDTSPLQVDIDGVFVPSTLDSYRNLIAQGPFATELAFSDPSLSVLMTERVQGLEVEDSEVTNGIVTGVEPDVAGIYLLSVAPTFWVNR